MAPQLVDLSPELHIKIADEIFADIDVDEIEDDKSDDPYNYNPEKPDEKQARKERASRQNRVRDLMNWSFTSRFF